MPCSTDSKPSAIILAGGRGRRMQHADKGLLELQNKKLIEHVIDNIQQDVDDIVISANRHHAQYKQYPAQVIADRAEHAWQGPLAGMASCLPHCQHDTVLVTSCDIPLLPAGLTDALMSALQQHDVSISEVDGRLQPVFIMRRHCLPSLNSALENRQRSLLKWITSQSMATVRFEVAPPLFSNINTPDELRELTGN